MSQEAKAGRRAAIKIDEGKAPPALGAYSHAVRAGDFIYLAGQGARHALTGKEAGITVDESGSVTAYDIKIQTRAVIENMKVVLEAAGCSLTDLVDISVYLKNMADFKSYNQVYSQYFSFESPPARTTVQVADLPGNNYIEMKAIAYRPEKERS